MEIFAVDGELYVGGRGVGLGYWNNTEKTAESFVEFPDKGRVYKTGDLVRLREDGNYEFIGRKDNQVKIRGNRIELGDIEAAMSLLKYIATASAIFIDKESSVKEFEDFWNRYRIQSPAKAKSKEDSGGFERKRSGISDVIIVYASLKEGSTPDRIKKDLGKLIPDYMIPSEIYVLDALPLTSTGKIDRSKLKEIYLSQKYGSKK